MPMPSRVSAISKARGTAILAIVIIAVAAAGSYYALMPKPAPARPAEEGAPGPGPTIAYALGRGISEGIAKRLSALDSDGVMDEWERALVDYLARLANASDAARLQDRAIDSILSDGIVSQEEARALAYLSGFPSGANRAFVELGLEGDVIRYLCLMASLGDQSFARYAVENRLCIGDGRLDDFEVKFLIETERHSMKLFEIYAKEGGKIYPGLIKELTKLPDLKTVEERDLEAVEDILYLALNSTNPEVREAFELMLKGGTPDRRDFRYQVPDYNTELQVLYWLACQNEFKKDDTLALAIAMVNGLWVSMGDDQVRKAVYRDANDLLNFFRETNEIQKAKGYYQLEDYPLEAKVALAWTGGLNMHWIGPLAQPKILLSIVYWKNERMPLIVYEKDTVSVETLRKMRGEAERKGWWHKDVNRSVKGIEAFFFFYPRHPGYWEFVPRPELILDENGLSSWLDVDWQFNRYLHGRPPRGDCGTETSLVDAWAKSMGIATTVHWMYKLGESAGSPSWRSHHYAIYFDPRDQKWRAFSEQAKMLGPPGTENEGWLIRYFIFRPPVDQRGYTEYRIGWSGNVPDYYYAKLAFCFKEIQFGQTKRMMADGVDTAQMKQWLLHS